MRLITGTAYATGIFILAGLIHTILSPLGDISGLVMMLIAAIPFGYSLGILNEKHSQLKIEAMKPKPKAKPKRKPKSKGGDPDPVIRT